MRQVSSPRLRSVSWPAVAQRVLADQLGRGQRLGCGLPRRAARALAGQGAVAFEARQRVVPVARVDLAALAPIQHQEAVLAFGGEVAPTCHRDHFLMVQVGQDEDIAGVLVVGTFAFDEEHASPIAGTLEYTGRDAREV